MFIHFRRDCEDTINSLEKQLKFNEEIRMRNIEHLAELQKDNMLLKSKLEAKAKNITELMEKQCNYQQEISALKKQLESMKGAKSAKHKEEPIKVVTSKFDTTCS